MRQFLRIRLFVLLLAVGGIVLLSAACDLLTNPSVCTLEFRMHTVEVFSPDGEPADSVQIRVHDANSGTPYPVCDRFSSGNNPFRGCHSSHNGHYVIFHDGLNVSSGGDPVVVRGEQGDLQFRAVYVFRDDGCHVEKEHGPDRVQLTR